MLLEDSKPETEFSKLHSCALYKYNWCVLPDDDSKNVETCWSWSFTIL